MQSHAERVYPEECCGLLLGKSIPQQQQKILVEIWEAKNSWDDSAAQTFQNLTEISALEQSKRRYYTIAPQELLKAQKAARGSSLDIVGVYHSHPDHQAIPSEFDRAIAWQEYSYIIISVCQGKAEDVCCWQLDASHQFQPEAIITQPN